MLDINSVIENVTRFMSQNTWDDDDFNTLALSLYEVHSRMNPVYAKYAVPGVDHWTKIPLMPISEFKTSDVGIQLSTQMPFPGVEFHSSGTTQRDKSKHRMYDTEAYRASIFYGFGSIGINPVPSYRVILLTPAMEHSSLYYMMSYISELFDKRGVRERFENLTDPALVSEWLKTFEDEDDPVIIFGTSLAYYDLMQTVIKLEGSPIVNLPLGSVILETGGWKGRDIQISPEALTESVISFFNIAEENAFREYSMSEISSQMYAWNNSVKYLPPAWLKTRVVDPLSQEEVPFGDSGVIGFIDLANVWSCPFILTEDMGHLYTDGLDIPNFSTRLVLEGRAVNAPEKGCSLSYVEVVDS